MERLPWLGTHWGFPSHVLRGNCLKGRVVIPSFFTISSGLDGKLHFQDGAQDDLLSTPPEFHLQ